MTHLDNAPPTHNQVIAVAVILIAILAFILVFVAVLLHEVRRSRAEEDA